MHADLEKYVKAGKLPADFAARLDKFSPGKYVLHQQWGVGKVAAWSLPKQKVKFIFENDKAHVMGLKLAYDLAYNQLIPLPEGHFLIACYDDPQGCSERAENKETLLDFLRMVLEHNFSLREGVDEVLPMEQENLEKFLSGRVISKENWKAWWEKARSAMRDEPSFRILRGEAIVLRHADTAAEALLADYGESTTLEFCVRILDQTRLDEVLAGEYATVAKLVKAMEEDIERAQGEPQHVLELIIIRDDIISTIRNSGEEQAAKLDAALVEEGISTFATLADKFATLDSSDIVPYIGELSPARQHEVYTAIREARGERWLPYVTNIFLYGGAKVTTPAAAFIINSGMKEQLFSDIINGLARQSLEPDVLIWICRERHKEAKEVVEKARMALGSAIINAIEKGSVEGGPNKALRLRNLLLEDKMLAPDLVTGISELEARPFAKALDDSSMLPELDRNLLMSNMIKVHPSLQEIVSARTKTKEKQSLYVSLRSYAARKAERDDLVNVRIPKNKHDLEVTRAEGDLRENGGYQDAKATRQVLMRRLYELERLLNQAEPTDFASVSCEETGMGTKVTFKADKGQSVVYTILGAWDSIPEQNVISYSSKLGAKLLGHKVGDSVRLPLEIGGKQVKMTVTNIEPADKSLIYPDEA